MQTKAPSKPLSFRFWIPKCRWLCSGICTRLTLQTLVSFLGYQHPYQHPYLPCYHLPAAGLLKTGPDFGSAFGGLPLFLTSGLVTVGKTLGGSVGGSSLFIFSKIVLPFPTRGLGEAFDFGLGEGFPFAFPFAFALALVGFTGVEGFAGGAASSLRLSTSLKGILPIAANKGISSKPKNCSTSTTQKETESNQGWQLSFSVKHGNQDSIQYDSVQFCFSFTSVNVVPKAPVDSKTLRIESGCQDWS